MNYYSFHIGDYAAHTQRLSLMEDLAYRRLIDAYYLAERPLNGNPTDVAREIGMLEQIDSVSYVLTKFFTASENGFLNDRCEKEITQYKGKKEQASNAGRASVAKRANARSTPVEINSTPVQRSQEPITINQEPKEKSAKALCPACPNDVDPQIWADWLQLRKTKKAPVTETVLREARAESIKAAMTFQAFLAVWCARGSQGMQADWIKPAERVVQSLEPGWRKDARDRMQKAVPGIAEKPPSSNFVFESDTKNVTAITLG